MTLISFCATILVIIAFGVAVFQVCLACGAPWGAFAFGGANVGRLPLRYRFISAASLLIYAIQAAVYAQAAGLVELPLVASSFPWLLWVFVGFFALGTIMNAISRSKPERYTWTPILVVSLVCALTVALNA